MSSQTPSIPPRPRSVVESVVAIEPGEPAVRLNLGPTLGEEQLQSLGKAPRSRFSADTTDQLMKLADLWDRGVLSSDEFAAEKAKLLA